LRPQKKKNRYNCFVEIKVVKTRKFLPPKDNLWSLIKESVPSLSENSIVAITSKVVSIGEGRCIPVKDSSSKEKIIIDQSEFYIKRSGNYKSRIHTISQGMLVGSAGIDESNSNGYYILWPDNPDESARKIWKFLRKEYGVKNVGVILTDSMAVPLKRGIVGRAISYYGFVYLKNYVGSNDLFGRKFKYTRTNIPDSLAAFAVYLMGEGREQTPIVILENLPGIKFVTKKPFYKKRFTSWKVPLEEDLFRPFWNAVKWKKGGR